MAEIDPERLARLLDGHLSDVERAELLRQLENDEEMRGVLADAAAALGAEAQLTGTEVRAAGSSVAPAQSTRHHRPRWWVPLAIAASVALVVSVPLLRRTAPPPPLPDGWNGTPWPTMRGPLAALPLEPRGVRVGARLEDLLRTDDPEVFDAIRRDLLALLADVPGAAPAEEALRRATPADRDHIAEELSVLLPSDALTLGRRLEAARVEIALTSQRDSLNARANALQLLRDTRISIPDDADRKVLGVALDSALARAAR